MAIVFSPCRTVLPRARDLIPVDPSHGKVISQDVIESATSTIGDPTHGVIVGSDFYYIANSGWDTLDDNGERKATAKVTPARIVASRSSS